MPPPPARRAARGRAAARCRRTRCVCALCVYPRLRQRHAACVSTLCGSKPASTCLQREQAAQHDAGAHQEHDRQRHLADDEQPARADADGCRRRCVRPPSARRSDRFVRRGVAGSAPARTPVSIDAPTTNRSTRGVDRDLFGAGHLTGRAAWRRPRGWRARAAGRRRRRPAASTSASTSSCWKTRARPAPSAERIASSLRRPSAAREQQVADVRARDQQDQRDRGEQHQQRRPDVADDQLLQRNHRRAPAGVLLRILALEPRRDRVHLRLRPRQRRRRASAARSPTSL